MTRKIKRTRDFELTLQIKNDDFIHPPREGQRNWLLNQALAEMIYDLNALDELAKKFVPGVERAPVQERAQSKLEDDDIMEDWQIPIMAAMAEVVAETHGDVLEIGFGRGVASSLIQKHGVRSHTIIEVNDSVVERFHQWRAGYAEQDIRLIHGRWQDVVHELESYDGIFFHTFPLNDEEYFEQAIQSVTFAEHFFPTAAAHLNDGGVFTYLTNEIDSLSREHQRLVFKFFRTLSLSTVKPLNLPQEVRDSWWADSMVVIKAVK